MSFRIKLNKSKNISFRVSPYSSSIAFTLVLPGVTISLSVKRLKKKSITLSDNGETSYKRIYNVVFPQLQPVEYRDIIRKISKLIKLNSLSNWLIPCFILSLLPTIMIKALDSYRSLTTILTRSLFSLGNISINLKMIITVFFILAGAIGVILKIYVKIIGRLRYDTLSNKIEVPSIWNKLATVDKLWHVVGIMELNEKAIKGNGGIPVKYERIPTKIRFKTPFFINTNSKVLQIKLENETLIILPDHYFLIRKSKVGIIENSKLMINVTSNPYAETESIPKDAKVVQTTWLYANKDGSKDKRYKDNEQIPICEYGQIHLETDTGFKILLLSSKYNFL